MCQPHSAITSLPCARAQGKPVHTLALTRAYCLRHSGWQFILSPTFASLRGQSDSDCPAQA